MSMSYRNARAEAEQRMKDAGVPDPAYDAAALLEYVTGMNRARYFLRQEDKMPEAEFTRYLALAGQRCERIPLQHLIGEQWFMGLPFRVNENVLIPRQDTETLVEEVLEICGRSAHEMTLLDLCTGSGCIAVSLAKLGGFAHTDAADISEKALAVARGNAAENLPEEVSFSLHCSDLFAAFAGKKYDVITANPPYIPSGEIPQLMPEVKDHDPVLALDGGGDGLIFYRRIASESREHLVPGGRIFLEIGASQGDDVSGLLRDAGFTEIRVIQDACGLDRVVTGHILQDVSGENNV